MLPVPRCHNGRVTGPASTGVGALGLMAVAFGALTACATARLETRSPTPGGPTLSILTYNVHLDRFTSAATLAAVGETQADVLCLMEVSDGWARVLRARYGRAYPHMLFSPGASSGLAVLSRFPLEEGTVIPGEEGRHPALRIVVHARGTPVQLLLVHLRPVFSGRGDPVSSWARVSEDHVAEIRRLMRALDGTVPTLVLGDFNEEPGGGALSWLGRAGFRNALPLFHPGQPTWRMPSPMSQLEATVDHILFDRSFVPLDARVVRGGRSDHLPVVARFEVRSPLVGGRGRQVRTPTAGMETGPANLSLETQIDVPREAQGDAQR